MIGIDANRTFRRQREPRGGGGNRGAEGFIGSTLRRFDFNRISRRRSRRSLEFTPGKSAPRLSGLPDSQEASRQVVQGGAHHLTGRGGPAGGSTPAAAAARTHAPAA